MKRPARERSSGSASVMSSPLKADRALGHLERRVAHDRVGEGRLAGAVGPHQRVDLALLDVEVEAAEDLLVLDAHVQVADLQLSQFRSVSGFRKSGSGGAADRRRGARRRALGRRTRPARPAWCPASALVTPPCTRVHSSFVEQARSPSSSCEQSTLPSGVSWKHSIGAICPSSASTTASIVISSAGLRQAVAAVGAAGRGDQARLAQLRDQVLEVGERQPLRLGDGAERDRRRAGLAAQLDHQAHSVLGFGREQHRPKSY